MRRFVFSALSAAFCGIILMFLFADSPYVMVMAGSAAVVDFIAVFLLVGHTERKSIRR